MSLSTTHVFAVGELVTAATVNSSIVNNVAYLVEGGATLASATALAITNEFHLVSGTTTIDSITTSSPKAGQQLRLVFTAGPITVRHNGGGVGNIRLVGGLHAGFVANESLELHFDGTNWIENTRSPRHLSGEGGIILSGTGTPTGMLAEDGSAISRTTYAAWFANVGTLYGAGDGTTTVNLPDTRGRMDVGHYAGGQGAVNAIGNNEGLAATLRRPQHRTSNSLSGTYSGSTGGRSAAHTHTSSFNQKYSGEGATGYPLGGLGYVYSGFNVGSTEVVYLGTGTESADHTHAYSGSVTLGGSIGTNNANDSLDTSPYLVRPKYTRI